jgi:hypothetical protein
MGKEMKEEIKLKGGRRKEYKRKKRGRKMSNTCDKLRNHCKNCVGKGKENNWKNTTKRNHCVTLHVNVTGEVAVAVTL